MENPMLEAETAKMELANRLFFRLYQCANMLHKTGTRAVDAQGLTTQQWAVLGALSRPEAADGMSVGDLARYLMVSRQNLSGLISRMERDGHLGSAPDGRDRRSRRITMTDSGRGVWVNEAQPNIRRYYGQVLADFSVGDMAHTLHYLLKLLDNMQRLDGEGAASGEDDAEEAVGAKPARPALAAARRS
ncbi:transcriptional regulator, MarR family [Acidovorax delafieldii 2AN]|uniref:Transcriptional regulator, MarR family n=1 Tax=Acidovorax delafieldii 2AN TaxID=573060 RepID=C5T920_ACIDE|nr:transcriptional regulator, MarR family [Acidovorax delafieldii 2AN]